MAIPEARCETCAAFVRVTESESGEKTGECALEIFKPPVRANMTCTRHRPKGAAHAAPRQRAAGEPRGRWMPGMPTTSLPGPVTRSASRDVTGPTPHVPQHAPLPKEIDLDMDADEFRRVLRQVISEELGVSSPDIGGRWSGGELVLRPGKEGTAEKRVPLEVFFKKIVMIRDKLRVLEAKVNAHDGLSSEDKVQLQAYITGCYGSLTTFNILFSDKADQFSGTSKDD